METPLDTTDMTGVVRQVFSPKFGDDVLVPTGGKGAELRKLLTAELGIPAKARWFEVRFAVDEVVTVTCEYMPTVKA